ncbi:glycosyltransferase family 2 protein [Flavobacterium marginilacus]|uniref:glycosyltransferase family 2 protein n=1 Tax=Flavobacterium marginilacus TaxID=3003256 RepID=UPI00248F2320|nr:glycosyltransferase family 2 protein [Flavobacterium marginilacus]
MLLISIITINYNNLEGLKKTIQSVTNQTWQEFEYIVIDGGSTDGCAEYIKSQNDKIDYWVSEPDKGIYNAMNKGIVQAKGEYLLFLNSGDHLFNNNVLENTNHFLAENDLIYFNLNFVDGAKSWIHKYPERLFFSYFILETLPHPATFIKRKLFDINGFYNEGFKIVSDWKFFIESVCRHNCSYKKIDETLSTYYLDGISSKSENLKMIFDERQLVLKTGFSAFLDDIDKLDKYEKGIINIKKSRKIRLLIKLGLLNKF